ncbi:MAG TPA: MBG domain-containing protein, partial [Candidatus Binatia bacterium]|nr:MBG domain-containing protein [Candidatus Binatia bacterium]
GDNITASYTTAAGTNSPVGSYSIVPSLNDPNSKLTNYSVLSTNGTLTITPANSANALVSSPNPSAQNSNVIFTATLAPVAPATATPTGAVQFFTNGVALGSPVSLSGGVASTSTALLPIGSNVVTAAYLGDGNFLASTNSLVQVVTANTAVPPVTVGISKNGNGTVTVTFRGTPGVQYVVQATSSLPNLWQNVSTNTAGTNGLWTFTDSMANHPQRFYRAANLGAPSAPALTVNVDNQTRSYGATNPPLTGTLTGVQNGDNITVTFSTVAVPASPVGAYSISPVFSDPSHKLANYIVVTNPGSLSITGATLTVTAVNKSRIYSAPNPALTASFSGFVNGETVNVLSGSPNLATAATTNSPVGSYTVTVAAGTLAATNYIFSFTNGTLTITPASSTNALSSSRNPAPLGSNITFTATLSPLAPATAGPTGTVQFVTNGVALGSPVTLSNGLASISTALLPAGSNTVTAVFTDDGNFLPSTNSLVQVITAVSQPPHATGIRANGNGTVTVSFLGTPSAQYVVQATANLSISNSWQNISTNTAGTDGVWTITDSAIAARRFFRAVLP